MKNFVELNCSLLIIIKYKFYPRFIHMNISYEQTCLEQFQKVFPYLQPMHLIKLWINDSKGNRQGLKTFRKVC